jgi:hypothetical protein
MSARISRALAAMLVCTGLSACRSAPPVAPLPTPTPPPSVTPGGPAFLEEDGSVRYHLVIRADAGVAFLPISVTALAGTGTIGWTRWTEATFAFDEAANRYLPKPASEGGEKREEWVNIVFPGSNQEMGIAVSYAGEPPPEERFRVVYATLALGELATHTYVKPAKTAAVRATEAVPREPLGDRLRSVDVSRWLTSGFFVPDIQTLDEVVVTVPGIRRDALATTSAGTAP